MVATVVIVSFAQHALLNYVPADLVCD
jgi:hypothetical protein